MLLTNLAVFLVQKYRSVDFIVDLEKDLPSNKKLKTAKRERYNIFSYSNISELNGKLKQQSTRKFILAILYCLL